MRGIYPVLCEIHYKDKHVNIKLPVRIRKIAIVDYVCDSCVTSGSIQKWLTYYHNHTGKRSHMRTKWDNVSGKHLYDIPPELKSNNGFNCPYCFLVKQENQEMRQKENILYNVYTSLSNTMLQVDEIARRAIPFRWHTQKRKFSIKVSAYYKSLKEIYDILDYTRKKRKKFNVKIFQIDEVRIEHEKEKYEQRRIAKHI